MKKIFILLALLILHSCSSFSFIADNIQNGNTLNANSIEKSIFKIMSYKHNSKFDTYEQYSIGSAILLNDNELITNAHVVVDENQNILDNFITCYNTDSSKNPDCRFIVKVKYIDKDNDLALLGIEPKDVNNNEVKIKGGVNLYNGIVSLQDDIYVYGYPFIGGDTITLSKGKVSGFTDDSDIKTDAKIDSGSSGGGAFKGKELIGISTYIISNNNTIGYIKPISKITNFLKNKEKYISKSIVNTNFLDYYKKIYSYSNGSGVYKNNGLTLSGFINDFKLYDISYSKLTDRIIFSGINSNKDIDIMIYGTHIYNKLLSDLDIINGVNGYLFKNMLKECDNESTYKLKNNFKCIMHTKSKTSSYISYVGYVINGDKLYVTIIKSDESNGKSQDYIKQLFSQIEPKMSYYDDSAKSNGVIGDINVSNIPNFTKVVFPSDLSSVVYEVFLLPENYTNIVGDMKILNSENIRKMVQSGVFNYDSYIYGLNKALYNKTGKDIYTIKKDLDGNQYIYGETEGFYDYLYMSYDGYIYETIFMDNDKDIIKTKKMINWAMNNIDMRDGLKVNGDINYFSFNQKTKKDLDGKWYIYENSLKEGTYDDNGIEYDIVSRNENVDVSSGSIILKNPKKDWHLNLAQTIKYSDDLLNKKFKLIFNIHNYEEDSYSVKLIVGKYIKDYDTQYSNKEYNLIFLNSGIALTDTISAIVDLWRKEYNFDDSVKPDIVRISIGINNFDGNFKTLEVKDLELIE